MPNLGSIKQFFQPLLRDISNWKSYHHYVLTRSSFSSAGRFTVEVALFLIGLVSFLYDGINSLKNPFLLTLTLLSWGITAVMTFLDWVANLDNKSLYTEQTPGAYDNVLPPVLPGGQAGICSPWKRKIIRVMKAGAPAEETAIYTNDDIDRWLFEGARGVRMERDSDYERDLTRKIRSNIKEVYKPFLRHNYRVSMFYGRQFTNEPKWGISREFYPGDTVIRVHRTCYFDTYLTNIIPGSQLRSNRREETVVEADGDTFMPYSIDRDGGKRLQPLGTQATANELGVTTLCILGETDTIPLWRQNHQAQSSRAQLVATGSGSADWDDCEASLKAEGKSFRDAVVRGMERELYEESIGTRSVTKQQFMDRTQTQITGYFRWLAKGGKSEFVGVSRTDLERLLDKIAPEESEVADGIRIPSRTVFALLEKLDELVSPDPEDPAGEVYISHQCSVSCSAAILALQAVCRRTVCANCPHREDCRAEVCRQRPFDVLFPMNR